MEDNVVIFPHTEVAEQNIRQQVRMDCAAVVALMRDPTDTHLEDALHLLNRAWGAVAGLMIARGTHEA